MKLEELAGALTELKKRIFIAISEDSAAEANENLLTELRKRIMAKQNQSVNKKETAVSPAPKPSSKKLNEQQSKFLKALPVMEQPDQTSTKATADSIQLEKSGSGYMIGVDSELPQQVKDLAKVSDSDMQRYIDTLTETAKKQLDQLL